MIPLSAGIRTFQETIYPEMKEVFHDLAKGQHPLALFITCSDSRVAPNLITHTPPGALFMLRNPGNFVPPPGSRCESIDATVEYAVSVLRVPHAIVCGHSDCGAMKALLDDTPHGPDLSYWLRHAKSVRAAVRQRRTEKLSPEETLDFAIKENIRLQLDGLKSHPCVARAIEEGRLQLHGWLYDIKTGEFQRCNPETGEFVPMD